MTWHVLPNVAFPPTPQKRGTLHPCDRSHQIHDDLAPWFQPRGTWHPPHRGSQSPAWCRGPAATA